MDNVNNALIIASNVQPVWIVKNVRQDILILPQQDVFNAFKAVKLVPIKIFPHVLLALMIIS